MKDDPTIRRARFVREYARDFNATRAAIRAGYSPRTARQQGSRLLTKPIVAAAVRRWMDARAAQAEVSVGRVLDALAAIAFSNVLDYLEPCEGGMRLNMEAVARGQAAGVLTVMVTERTVGRGKAAHQVRRVRLKMTGKLAALEMLGQHLGLFRRPAGGRTPRIAAGLAAARQRVQADKAPA